MAQPPNTSEAFFKEVDENLRRDQIQDFVKAYSGWLIAGLILFLAACGGIIWYQQHREERAQAQVEQLATISREIGTGDTAKVPQQLDALSDSGSKGVRATALFTQAAFAA